MASAYPSVSDPFDPDSDRIIEEKEFVDKLKCHVCHLVPRVTPVWQCVNSHLTCKACFMFTPRCPKCYEPRTRAVRNLMADEMLDSVTYYCRFAENGCNFESLRADILAHENGCAVRDYRCPMESCNIRSSAEKISEHFDTHHPDVDTDGKDHTEGGGSCYWQDLVDCLATTILRITTSNGRKFFLQCKQAENVDCWHIWMYMAGKVEDANKYSCEMSIYGKDSLFMIGFKGSVLSLDVPFGAVPSSDAVLIINNTFAKKIGSIFNFSLRIYAIAKLD